MQDIITVSNEITLCTGMTSAEFAKANMFQHMKTAGFIATPVTAAPTEETAPVSGATASAKSAAIPRDFTFNKWFFEKTTEDEHKILHMVGIGFGGKTLYDMLTDCSKSVQGAVCTDPSSRMQQTWHTVTAVLNAMQSSISQGITLPNTGPLGIIIGDSGEILFLPEILLNRAAAIRSQETAAACTESWRQLILPTEHTLSFSAATILYTALSGKKAFTAKSMEEVTADFLDNNFIPLEYVASVKPSVAAAVNTALMGKLNFRPPLSKLIEALPDSIGDAFCKETESKTANEASFNAFTQKQAKKIKRTRFLHKNFTRIAVAFVLCVGLGIAITSYVKEVMNKPTTVGLTPVQTVEAFYTAINHLDTEGMEACAAKDASKAYVNSVANVFVVSKMRTVYEKTQGFITPSQWIISSCNDNDSVFGVTNFTVNGTAANASAEWLSIPNKNREPLIEEEGKTQTVTARFYNLISDGEDSVTVTKRVDTLNLTFTKGKWHISEIIKTETPVPFDRGTVTEAVRSLIAETDDNAFPIKRAEELRAVYEWFPTEQELLTACDEIIKRYSFF